MSVVALVANPTAIRVDGEELVKQGLDWALRDRLINAVPRHGQTEDLTKANALLLLLLAPREEKKQIEMGRQARRTNH